MAVMGTECHAINQVFANQFAALHTEEIVIEIVFLSSG